MDHTKITLGMLISSHDETIMRNAMSILKCLQKCKHENEKVDGITTKCLKCMRVTYDKPTVRKPLNVKIDTCFGCDAPFEHCTCIERQ